MKRSLPFILLAATASLLLAQMPPKPQTNANANSSDLGNWGTPTDPDGDCTITGSGNSLVIRVPGSRPHDLSPELSSLNAPRVLTPIEGNFKYAVQVSGAFNPGAESTQDGRPSYNGAGIVAMADERNFFTVLHGVYQMPGQAPMSYVHVEVRLNGERTSFNVETDHPIPQNSPVYLGFERRGQQLGTVMSTDGKNWKPLGMRDIPADWSGTLQLGVVAISTSKREFNPQFSK